MKADIQSIMIYLLGLLLTILSTKLYTNKKAVHSNQVFKLMCLVTMALPLSLIAGFRINVGTDYSVYCVLLERFANYSFSEIFQQDKMEVGFVLLIKVLSYISSDLKFLFFSIEFITLMIAFKAAMSFDNHINLSRFVVVYYIVIYHYSLNICRQCLAVSIILLAVSYLCNNNIKAFLVATIVASFIHTTALFCMLYVFSAFQSKVTRSSAFKKTLFYSTIVISPFLLYLLFENISLFTFVYKYERFMYETSQFNFGNIFIVLLYVIPLIALLNTWNLSEYVHDDIIVKNLCNVLLFLIPFSFIGMFANYGTRVLFYVKVVFALFLALLNQKELNDRKKGIVIPIRNYYIIILICEYVLRVLISNNGETFPYLWK